DAGLTYSGHLLPDGKLHRIRASGDRHPNSWYILHAGPPSAGAFGCWRRDIKEKWCERHERLSPEELSVVRKKWMDADTERRRVEAANQEKARKGSEKLMRRASPATHEHPYLTGKGIRVHGDLRLYHGALVLPLCDENGHVHSLQFISRDGQKRFLS